MIRRAVYLFIAVVAIVLTVIAIVWPRHRDTRINVASDACAEARQRINQASDFSNADEYRDAYDATLPGLRANAKCQDRPTKIVNQGYLLSTKAIAEYAFSDGRDSLADIDSAIAFLERCQKMASSLGRAVSDLCRKQEHSDLLTRRQLAVRRITFP